MIGVVQAEEVVEVGTSEFSINGEFSQDITNGEDNMSFTTPYTGVILTGDGFEISSNLTDGMVNIEEAKFNWSVTEDITVTFGKQAEPYGIAWGLHRPSNNPFISEPREHSVYEGVGVGIKKWGVGFNALYSNANEEGDNFWGARVSYSKWNTTFGLSLNSNEAQLVDVSGDHSILGIPVQTSFEYDLAAEDEAGESDPSFWLRGKVSPEFAKGAFFMLGYNSNEELSYGLGYNCSDKVYISSELSNGVEGDESDLSIRVSYKF
tara:strand:+ start:121 stop:912 length:792 start_codon:yes stop_codon:yes gene_type:complete